MKNVESSSLKMHKPRKMLSVCGILLVQQTRTHKVAQELNLHKEMVR